MHFYDRQDAHTITPRFTNSIKDQASIIKRINCFGGVQGRIYNPGQNMWQYTVNPMFCFFKMLFPSLPLLSMLSSAPETVILWVSRGRGGSHSKDYFFKVLFLTGIVDMPQKFMNGPIHKFVIYWNKRTAPEFQ